MINNTYSKIKHIDNFVKSSINNLVKAGYELKYLKDINYGTRYEANGKDSFFKFTIYYSRKKGISIVKDLNVDFNDFDKFLKVLGANVKEEKTDYDKWIGTDEAGKGDYFGPLVVAGFVIKNIEKDFIKSLGVKDSKKLSDNRILEIFEKLKNNYMQEMSIKILMPYEYNTTIENFRSKGETLNDLLGCLHSQVILDLYKKHDDVDCIIVDQFTHQDKVYHRINDSITADYIQRIKAENDIAVATASIVARATFLKKLKEMGEEYSTVFPKGASKDIIDKAIEFSSNYGIDSLKNVAKIHFKTTNSIVENL